MAKDLFHDNVRAALVKEGWKITADPLRISISETAYMEVDLAAESVFTAEREGEKIAVEIKSFVAKSFISAFHEAMGQYLDYKSALADTEPEREVYLAVPTMLLNTSCSKAVLSKKGFGRNRLNSSFSTRKKIQSSNG